MRWILLILVLLFVVQASANEIPGKDAIRAILQTVDPAKPETKATAEEALVALGKDALPEMQAAADGLETAPATVLDRAMVRLQTGFNWPQLIRLWVKQQYRPDQQAVADSLPEPVRVTDPQVERAFSDYLFYISRYPQRPVENRIQPPLSANNLFAVKKDIPFIAGQMPPPKQIVLLTDVDLLKAFFLAVPKPLLVPNVDTDYEKLQADTKNMAYVWLRLSEEIRNDGFFRFSIPAESLKFAVSMADAGGFMTRGRAEVAPAGGNSGFIEASLFFNRVGLLIDVKEVVKLVTGPRPID